MHKRSKAQQDMIIRFQQLGTFHTALTQLCKFTQPRGYPLCCVDGSHGHRSIIYIRILRCTPPTPTLSCLCQTACLPQWPQYTCSYAHFHSASEPQYCFFRSALLRFNGHTALTQLRKFTQPRGYPPCGVDGSHSHCSSIIYIRIFAGCTPPTSTLSCQCQTTCLPQWPQYTLQLCSFSQHLRAVVL